MACWTVSRLLCAGALAAGLAGSSPPAGAVEPRGIEVIGLRLGLAAAEVLTRLQAQGAQEIRPVPPHCHEPGDASCLSSLTAHTKDGKLEVGFGSAGAGVIRIDYTLSGRAPNEQQVIRLAVFDRFGPPSVAAPARWCSASAARRGCPDDSPRLELTEGPGTAMRLVLTAGDTGAAPPAPGARPSSALPAGQSQAKKAGQHRQ